jgi:HEAT repeats/HEAT repeat
VAVWPRWQECRRVRELVALLGDPDGHVRANALLALGEMGPAAADAAPALTRAWGEGHCSPGAVTEAVVKIGWVALPALLDALQHDDWETRRRAILCLARFGPDARRATPILIELVRGGDRELMRCAIYALGKIGPDAWDSVPDLRRAQSDLRPDIRAAATRALERIGSLSASEATVPE